MSERVQFIGGQIYTGSTQDADDERKLLGTCVEGVRVEFDTPGFKGRSIVAIANVTGPNAPKTNVARSGLETTPELDRTLETIYQIYLNHIKKEVIEMQDKRLF